MVSRDDQQDAMAGVNLNLNTLNMTVNMSQQEQLAHHRKHIQALWRHIERLEKVVQLIPEGVKIKTGMSEILVLKNGGIILDGQRILLKTPGKDQLLI